MAITVTVPDDNQPATPPDTRPVHLHGTDFKTDADMRSAYDALRSKMSTDGAPKKPEAPPAPAAPPAPQKKDGEQPPAPPQEKPKQDAQAFSALEAAGLKPAEFTAELSENGTLSKKSYDALAAKGFPEAAVDAYLKGLGYDPDAAKALQIEKQNPVVTEAQKIIAKAQVDEMVAAVGGEEQFKAMGEWARANQDKVDLKAYNEAVSSGDKTRAQMAVMWLNGKFTAANGQAPARQIVGAAPVATGEQGYGSWDEVTTAMSDPRYKSHDPAYVAKVQQKLKVSKL